MSTRDIHDQLKDIYGIEVSAEMVSRITDKILPEVKEWQAGKLYHSSSFNSFDKLNGIT